MDQKIMEQGVSMVQVMGVDKNLLKGRLRMSLKGIQDISIDKAKKNRLTLNKKFYRISSQVGNRSTTELPYEKDDTGVTHDYRDLISNDELQQKDKELSSLVQTLNCSTHNTIAMNKSQTFENRNLDQSDINISYSPMSTPRKKYQPMNRF